MLFACQWLEQSGGIFIGVSLCGFPRHSTLCGLSSLSAATAGIGVAPRRGSSANACIYRQGPHGFDPAAVPGSVCSIAASNRHPSIAYYRGAIVPAERCFGQGRGSGRKSIGTGISRRSRHGCGKPPTSGIMLSGSGANSGLMTSLRNMWRSSGRYDADNPVLFVSAFSKPCWI